MKKVLACLVIFSFIFSFQACSKKRLKKEDEGAVSGVDKSKVAIVDIGYSGPMKVIYFEFDRSTLTEEARGILKENAKWLKSKKNIKVQVEGHCDNRGTNEYNLALGQKRADAVRVYLIDLGLQEDRLTTISYGEEKPQDLADTEEAWAKNRKAEFIITDT